jgi:hypothetical protein
MAAHCWETTRPAAPGEVRDPRQLIEELGEEVRVALVLGDDVLKRHHTQSPPERVVVAVDLGSGSRRARA